MNHSIETSLLSPAVDEVKLLEDIKKLTEIEQACIAMHCLVEVHKLERHAITLNYSKLMYARSSDRLVQIFEDDFFHMRPSQMRWLGKQLIGYLWQEEEV